jgi:membrane protein YdbS with pleckstrin-like domain
MKTVVAISSILCFAMSVMVWILAYKNQGWFSFSLVGVLIVTIVLCYRYMVYLPAKRDRELFGRPCHD